MDMLRRNLELYLSEYEHVTLLGDFKGETKEPCMQSILKLYALRNLILEPTCFKNPKKPSSIDLILTNSSSSFQNFCTIVTSLSSEAVVWRCSVKKVFLKVSQNSQENETLSQLFSCEFCEIFRHTFFIEHPRWLLL